VKKIIHTALLGIIGLLLVNWHSAAWADLSGDIAADLGNAGACMLADEQGEVLLAVNPTQALVPASILKLLTALLAFHHLGVNYRFPTTLYLDTGNNLTVKGHGDPLLISENIEALALFTSARLSSKSPAIEDILLDGSYFAPDISVPGVSDSLEPYDAPNGALCANFNTVFFQRKPDGTYESAEAQTPLLPMVTAAIRASGLAQGRIILSPKDDETMLYMGHLFRFFLEKAGVTVAGKVRIGMVRPETDQRLGVFESPATLSQVVTQLMAFSNNFIANQIMIAAGAKADGPPGSLANGVRALHAYAQGHLKLQGINIAEGSGISRRNRISAAQMMKLLSAFRPHATLMRETEREYYKTGTLKNVSTRAGYIKGKSGLYPYVVMINAPGKTTEPVMKKLIKSVLD